MRKGIARIRGIWAGMKARCNNPNNCAYEKYGAKGIKVCEEWNGSKSDAFVEWSLNNGYADNLSIDRIDNSKGYEPSNCRWVTTEEQLNNRNCNFNITAFGTTQTYSQWARLAGMDRKTLKLRVQSGMTPEEALTRPLMKNGYVYKQLNKIV